MAENKEEKDFRPARFSCEEWVNAKPSRKVDLPTFFA